MSALFWIGFGLSGLAAFALSLFHMAMAQFSKISISRFLEGGDPALAESVLVRFDEIRIAIDFWRIAFLLAFLAGLLAAFPGLVTQPLGLFLGALLGYGIGFDVLPRLIGAAAKDALLRLFLPSHRLFLALSRPVLWAASWGWRREEDGARGEPEREASEREIETFIDEAAEEGIIAKDEHELLRSVVEFGDTTVREIMTPRGDVVAIRRDATIQTLRKLIIAEKYSRVPVFRDRLDNAEGVVLAKDLLAFSEPSFDASPIEPLIRAAVFVPESMKVDDLLRELQRARQKMALVVDEHGAVTGLVTMEDVVEEIVGEIQDEYDMEESQIVTNGPGDLTVGGTVKVEELEDALGLELAEEDFLTASGLLIHELGRLPHKGEVVRAKGLDFEILDVDPKRIRKMRVRSAPAEEVPE